MLSKITKIGSITTATVAIMAAAAAATTTGKQVVSYYNYQRSHFEDWNCSMGY